MLQTQKLLNSVLHARRKGYKAPLTAAELEMMNLTGDGNGFDMVTMPQEFRQRVPTANFFQQMGYERNRSPSGPQWSQRCLHRSTPRWIRRRSCPAPRT